MNWQSNELITVETCEIGTRAMQVQHCRNEKFAMKKYLNVRASFALISNFSSCRTTATGETSRVTSDWPANSNLSENSASNCELLRPTNSVSSSDNFEIQILLFRSTSTSFVCSSASNLRDFSSRRDCFSRRNWSGASWTSSRPEISVRRQAKKAGLTTTNRWPCRPPAPMAAAVCRNFFAPF